MSLENIVLVDMYLNPATDLVEAICEVTPFGMSKRVNLDWQLTNREDFGLDNFGSYKIYRLNWKTDFIPMDSDEEEREHIAIDLFDQGLLNEEGCIKYGILMFDPERFPEFNNDTDQGD